MYKQYAPILLGLCVTVTAQAGIFADDDARKRIQQVDARVALLEGRVVQAEEGNAQQTKSVLDLQGQIDVLNAEIRKLRGQNEELAHGLQEAEKRQKDFYVDLDTRLRHFESMSETGIPTSSVVAPATTLSDDPFDPGPGNRAYEAAYGIFKGGGHTESVKAFRDFLQKFPASVYVPNAQYWLGAAQFALKNYNSALDIYQELLKSAPNSPLAADVYLNIAACQQELKQSAAAQKTLKHLIATYPNSEAAVKAKTLLAPK